MTAIFICDKSYSQKKLMHLFTMYEMDATPSDNFYFASLT